MQFVWSCGYQSAILPQMTMITTKYRNRRKGNCLIILSILIYFLRGASASFLCLRNGSAILQTWFNGFVFNNEFTERCLLMKLNITTIIAASLLFAGCASTTKAPPVVQYSEKPVYVWDDSKSLALNITKASIEVPPSLRDTKIPDGASVTQSGAWKDTAAVVDLLSNGLGGFFGGELFRSTSGKKWQPTYVKLVPAEQGLLSLDEVTQMFNKSFTDMFAQVDEVEFHGFFAHMKMPNNSDDFHVKFTGSYCDSQAFPTKVKDEQREIVRVYGGVTYLNAGDCAVGYRLNPVTKLSWNGQVYYSYSVTALNFYQYLLQFSQFFDGFFVHPARASESGRSDSWGLDYPYVIHNKRMHLFTSPEQSIQLN